MKDTDLMKFHIAAVKMILSLDQPNLPPEKVNRLINYAKSLNLPWSGELMKFFLQATMGTCQIIKNLCNKNAEEK